MIPKYLSTLAITVAVVTLAVSSRQFATRAQMLSGTAFSESLQFDFTIDADSTHTYEVTPSMSQFIRTHVAIHTDGPARVVAGQVDITPKDVSWTENRRTITSTGAAMSIDFQWDTPSDAPDGDHGHIYLDFPEIPGLEGKPISFHSGVYEKDGGRRYLIREMTTYRSTLLLSLARLLFALSAGLPIGLFVHTICWVFGLKGERRSRVAALPAQNPGLPRIFYPNPVAEWSAWLRAIGWGAFIASIMAGFAVADGFMSSSFMVFIYIVLAAAAVIGLALVYFTGERLLTVQVGNDGLSYARGRRTLQWLNAAWRELRTITEKSRTYRGNTTYWIEITFNNNRKTLKIDQSIEGYPALRDLIFSLSTFSASH